MSVSASVVCQFADVKQSWRPALREQERHMLLSDRTRVSPVMPLKMAEQLQANPMPLRALLKHEKACWMNCATTPTTDLNGCDDGEIENNDIVIALVDGFRLLSASPLYSEVSSDPVH